jgi:hypothetical protein
MYVSQAFEYQTVVGHCVQYSRQRIHSAEHTEIIMYCTCYSPCSLLMVRCWANVCGQVYSPGAHSENCANSDHPFQRCPFDNVERVAQWHVCILYAYRHKSKCFYGVLYTRCILNFKMLSVNVHPRL